jgi:hypothetical protein
MAEKPNFRSFNRDMSRLTGVCLLLMAYRLIASCGNEAWLGSLLCVCSYPIAA